MDSRVNPAPEWLPFRIADRARGERPDPTRSMDTPEGVTDRLRAAAFAELQAQHAFEWAAEHFAGDASEGLRQAWRELAIAEKKHLHWLLQRLHELGSHESDRKVSDQLWLSLRACTSARDFALFMASAEERGRIAGERFHQAMLERDPISAKIFGDIAREEVEHIQLASRHFNWKPSIHAKSL